jgi:hypothetical protein
MGAFYRRLLSRGKRKKQALVAVAHKLLRRMMGRLREYYAGQSLQGWLDRQDSIKTQVATYPLGQKK